MKKITLLLFLLIASFGYSQNTVSSDVGATWLGYLNAFDNPADLTPDCGGGFCFGSAWGVPDLKTVVGANDVTLFPNINLYGDGTDPYWGDGGDGNKICEANSFIEPGASFQSQDLTFTGNVTSNTLDGRYTVQAFIKTVGGTDFSKFVDLPASGVFSVSATAAEIATGVLQYGFVMVGLNANPATDWGSVVIAPIANCFDGIQNQGEAGIDCGGPCGAVCPPPPVASFVDDFEAGLGDYGVGTDGGTLTALANPDQTAPNTSANVAQLEAINTGLYTHIEKTVADKLDLSSGDRGFSIQVKGPSNINVTFQVEGGTLFRGDVMYTNAPNWQTIIFDASANTSTNNNKVVVFFDIENATTPGGDFLFDNIVMGAFASLGTDDFKIEGLSVYPNPSKNKWTVKTKNIEMQSIQVYNILGKRVLSLAPNASEVKIDGSSLTTGLYFAQIKSANGVSSIKLVKQ